VPKFYYSRISLKDGEVWVRPLTTVSYDDFVRSIRSWSIWENRYRYEPATEFQYLVQEKGKQDEKS
jgi:hypothetical protein